MSGVAFVDVETTGLDPDVHQIWEVALILPDGSPDGSASPGTEKVWQLPVDLGLADSRALEVGRFWERRGLNQHGIRVSLTNLRDFSDEFSKHTRGLHLCGAVVSFDEERLRRLLRKNGACPGWNYHLIDVENLAVGFLAAQAQDRGYRPERPPWKSEDLSRLIGVEPNDFERHTALGDARWAKAMYKRVMGVSNDEPGRLESAECEPRLSPGHR